MVSTCKNHPRVRAHESWVTPDDRLAVILDLGSDEFTLEPIGVEIDAVYDDSHQALMSRIVLRFQHRLCWCIEVVTISGTLSDGLRYDLRGSSVMANGTRTSIRRAVEKPNTALGNTGQ